MTTPKPLQKNKWTHTNSDERTLQNQRNVLSRWLYSLSLMTGYYAIETTDRRISLLVAVSLLMVSTIMCYVLVQGFRDGMRAAWQDVGVTQ